MRRIVSIWFPDWPLERMRLAEEGPPSRPSRPRQTAGVARRELPVAPVPEVPLALVASGAHGLTVTAANRAARAAGVGPGQALAGARAVLPSLATRAAEPARDQAALLAMARWLGRYGPARNGDGVDGLWVDTTGVAHLYGGEEPMLAGLHQRLARLGLTARIGLAGTLAAAAALARCGTDSRHPWRCAANEETAAVLAPLPIAALRLDGEALVLARRLGLRRIGQLYGLPRASLARRFRSDALVAALLGRLDAAVGHAAEPRASLAEVPELRVLESFPEPLISSEGLLAAVRGLAERLCGLLAEQQRGLRRARLTLYRADGTSAEIGLGTSAPMRRADHVMRLLAGKLEGVDAGFGIDAVTLEALASEPLGNVQEALSRSASRASDARGLGAAGGVVMAGGLTAGGEHAAVVAELVDRLAARLGPAAVQGLEQAPSHRPERASRRRTWLALGIATGDAAARRRADGRPAAALDAAGERGARPPLLLERPEPIAVVAEVPDGPPLRFTWRRREYRVVRAEGPERIAPEWWRSLPSPSPGQEAERLGEGDGCTGGSAAAFGERVARPPAQRVRDYYRVEDRAGGRYWLYRDGLYDRVGEEGAPRWFLHGLFG